MIVVIKVIVIRLLVIIPNTYSNNRIIVIIVKRLHDYSRLEGREFPWHCCAAAKLLKACGAGFQQRPAQDVQCS